MAEKSMDEHMDFLDEFELDNKTGQEVPACLTCGNKHPTKAHLYDATTHALIKVVYFCHMCEEVIRK